MLVFLARVRKAVRVQTPDAINSAEAADICGVDRATFNRWAAKDLVPVVMVAPSGARIYSRRAIEQWAAKRPRKVSAA